MCDKVLMQRDGNYAEPRYFYLHDRLGSVRLTIDEEGNVKTYSAGICLNKKAVLHRIWQDAIK